MQKTIKKIKLFFYKDENNLFAVKIDYNGLFYEKYSLNHTERRLLGGENDRIEAYFMRKKYIKITEKEFIKLLTQFNLNN
jgi:hypothetical protein